MVNEFVSSGYISLTPSDEEVRGLLRELDENGNGRVEQEEFKTFILKYVGMA